MTENLPAPSPTRADLLGILGVLALAAVVLLVPVTRDFVFTNVGIVFHAVGTIAAKVGGFVADAALAARLLGGVA